MGNPSTGPSNQVARNAYGDILKIKGELECQVCLGDRQIHTKCFLTEQTGSDLSGLDWLYELGLIKQIIKTTTEDQMPTSVALLTEGALKEK